VAVDSNGDFGEFLARLRIDEQGRVLALVGHNEQTVSWRGRDAASTGHQGQEH
jgi:hypothetical protein